MAIELRKILNTLYPKSPASGATWVSRLRMRRLLLILLGGLLILKIVGMVYYYNLFLARQYDCDESHAQIETILQRRRNVQQMLTTMVEDYAKHEKTVFKDIADTRAATVSRKPGGAAAAAGMLEAELSKIIAFAEQYPMLKLNESYLRFMDAVVDTENKLVEQRLLYNKRVNVFSTAVGLFPGNIFQWYFRFRVPPYFEPEAEVRDTPKGKY